MPAYANGTDFRLATAADGSRILTCGGLDRSAAYEELYEQRPWLAPFYTQSEKAGLSVCYGLDLAKSTGLETWAVAAAYVLFVAWASRRSTKTETKAGPDWALGLWHGAMAAFAGLGVLRTAPHLASNIVASGWDFSGTVCSKPESMAAGAGAWGVGATGVWVQLFVASKLVDLGDTALRAARRKPIPLRHWLPQAAALVYARHAYASEASHALYVVAANYLLQLVVRVYRSLRALRALASREATAGLVTCVQMVEVAFCLGVQVFALRAAGIGCAVDASVAAAGALFYAFYLAVFAEYVAGFYFGTRRGAGAGAVAAAALVVGVVAGLPLRVWAARAGPAIGTILALQVARQFANRWLRFPRWPSPGFPTTLPLLGNAVAAGPAFMRYLLRQAKARGGLFLFWPGGPNPMCVIANPQAAKKVLADPKTFPKGSDYKAKFGMAFGEGLVTSAGEAHSRARRILGRFFNKDRLEEKKPVILEAFDATIRDVWGDLERKGSGDVDVQQLFHLATLRAFGKAMLSEDVWTWFRAGKDKEPGDGAKWCAEEVSFGSNVIGEHMLFDLPMSSCFARIRRLKRAVHGIRRELIWPRAVARRDAIKAGGVVEDDCLTALMTHQLEDPSFTDDQVMDQLITLLGAGHDTSAYFCCYACLELARNPDVQEALRDEFARGDVEWKDSLLQRVVQEVLRLYPVIPMVTRVAAKAASLPDGDGKFLHVPAGSRAVVPFFLLNRLPSVWGADASQFKPDRWLENQRAKRSDAIFSTPKGFLPFGYGTRTCIGYGLAMVEARVFLPRLLAKYTLSEVPGFTPLIKAGISLTVENPRGIKIRFEKRA